MRRLISTSRSCPCTGRVRPRWWQRWQHCVSSLGRALFAQSMTCVQKPGCTSWLYDDGWFIGRLILVQLGSKIATLPCHGSGGTIQLVPKSISALYVHMLENWNMLNISKLSFVEIWWYRNWIYQANSVLNSVGSSGAPQGNGASCNQKWDSLQVCRKSLNGTVLFIQKTFI